MSSPSTENLVEFEDYVAAIGRRRKLIVVVVAGFVVLGALFSIVSTKQYTSESRVSVTPIFDPGTASTEEVNIDTERGIAKSSAVATIAQRSLGSDASPSDLLDRVTVDAVGESTILAIRYTHTDPEAAYRGADAFARAYLQFRGSQADDATRQARQGIDDERAANQAEIARLEARLAGLTPGSAEYAEVNARLRALDGRQSSLDRQLQDLAAETVDPGTIIDEAEVPESPSSPGLVLNVAGAALIGLVLALTATFVLERKNLGRRPDGRDGDTVPAVEPAPALPPAGAGVTPAIAAATGSEPAATPAPEPAPRPFAPLADSTPGPAPSLASVLDAHSTPAPAPAAPERPHTPRPSPALPAATADRRHPAPVPAESHQPRHARPEPPVAGARPAPEPATRPDPTPVDGPPSAALARTPAPRPDPEVGRPTPVTAAPSPPAPPSTPADRRQRRDASKALAGLEVELLGQVPRLSNDAGEPAFESVALAGPAGEALRRLHAALRPRLEQRGARVVLVTSAIERGVTVGLAGGLAATAALAGQDALLIAGDLHQPRLHDRLELGNDQGLAEVLRGSRPLSQVLQGWSGIENLCVVTAGRPGADPSALVSAERLGAQLATIRDEFELIVIEGPPVGETPDATVMASVSDAVVLAVDPRHSAEPELGGAVSRLRLARADLVGAVVVEARAPRPEPAAPVHATATRG